MQPNQSTQHTVSHAPTDLHAPAELSAVRDAVRRHMRELEGEVLTVMDASLPPEQAKAAKDIMRSAFNRRITVVYRMFSGCDNGD